MVAFSVATADQLISAAKNTAGKLRAQGPIREHLMTQALEDFSGGYARAFTQNCVAESEARGRLAGVLEDLVPQLQEAKWQYEQEQSRQANLAAWWDRETARQIQRVTVPAGGVFLEPWDPKPSADRIVPSPIHSAFECPQRNRAAISGDNGRVSAAPERLRTFVQQSHSLDIQLGHEQVQLRNAWLNFTGSCSWVPIGSNSFIGGFEDLLQENQADVTWLKDIADQFVSIAGATWNWLDEKLMLTPPGILPNGWDQSLWAASAGMTYMADPAQRARMERLTKPVNTKVGWLPKPLRRLGKRFPSTQKFISWATDYRNWDAHNTGQFAKPHQRPSSFRGRVFQNLTQIRTPKKNKAKDSTKAAQRWGNFGKVLGPASAGMAGIFSGYDQWQQDSQDPNMRTSEKVGRTATVGISVAGHTGIGAWGGAALGAAIGSAIAPGAGTVIGGFVGGVIGGVAGTAVGQKIGDMAKDFGGKFARGAADTFDAASKGLADGAKAVGDFFGGMFGKS